MKTSLKFWLKKVTLWPLHFGTGILTVKIATKFEILSLYSSTSSTEMTANNKNISADPTEVRVALINNADDSEDEPEASMV